MQQFIAASEARRIILETAPGLPAETVGREALVGRTLAAPLVSALDLPPFDNSAVDGYALRAADLPARLRVAGAVRAGDPPGALLPEGACLKIMTGAPLPEGADAVAPVEWAEAEAGGRLVLARAPSVGQYVRRAGADARWGQVVLREGDVVQPRMIGMLAALGAERAVVSAAPTVAIVSTGDELAPPEGLPQPGQIRDANGPGLAALAVHAGGRAHSLRTARDAPEALAEALWAAADADVLVLSGGVSVGDYDYVRAALADAGATLLFWQVRQRPGKPMLYALWQGKPVFGLPGNPVSAAVCFSQYVRPALARMLGRKTLAPPTFPVRLAHPIDKPPELTVFARARVHYDAEGRACAGQTGPQDSNLLTSVVQAEALLHLPEGPERLGAGAVVEAERIDW